MRSHWVWASSFIALAAPAVGSVGEASERKPEVIEAIAPHYPENYCGARVQGRIEVDGVVSLTGKLVQVTTHGVPPLQEVAKAAAEVWRFRAPSEPTPVHLAFIFVVVPTTEAPGNVSTTLFRPPYEVEVRCGLAMRTVSVGRK